MSPKILDEDIALVQQQPVVKENEIGIFILNGDCYCKRLVVQDGVTYLVSLNPRYDSIPVRDYDELRTIGKVIGKAQIH